MSTMILASTTRRILRQLEHDRRTIALLLVVPAVLITIVYFMYENAPLGEGSGGQVPLAVENFHALRQRQTSDTAASPDDKGGRVNLLNWDTRGRPEGLFPPRDGDGSEEPRA